jgi:hypothetical protein
MNEYVLTADEKGMLETIKLQADELQLQLNLILRTILRYRKLPDGQWSLEGDKLVRK